jgi:hypothetical protein
MLIALVIAIVVTNIITGYTAFKAVQIGLRWNMQLNEGKEPTISNPIKEHIEKKEQKEEAAKIAEEQKEAASAFSSYFGPADIYGGGDK